MKEYKINEMKNIRLQGRNGRTAEGSVVLFWAAAAIEVNVKATEVWAHISADYENLEIWISVEVNGAQIQRIMLPKEPAWICLARNLNPQKENLISIIKDTQPMPGDNKHILKVDGFKIDDAGEFCGLKPRRQKIEFIGDSLTSGEGLSGRYDEMDWIPLWFCASRTYAVQTAKRLDADWNCISQSGWGLCWSWDGNDKCRIPAYYSQVCGLLDGKEQKEAGSCLSFDFNGGSDLVILNLGTNDESGFPGFENKGGEQRIVTEAKLFLSEIRRNNPHAKIIWTWGMMPLRFVPDLIKKGIDEYKKESGDNSVYTLELESMYSIEKCDADKGSRGHPGLLAHKKAAEKIAAFIESINNL